MRTIIAIAELHLPGSVAPFPPGSEISLPEERAAELVQAGVAEYADTQAA